MSSATPVVPLPAPSRARRATAVVAILLAMLMSNIDTSIVNVALPRLGRDLRVPAADTVWVATAYLLAVSCAIPAVSGLADQIGRRRTFLIGTPVFTLASLACALAPSLPLLVAARVVQGAGAAFVFAVAIPLYRHLFPPERLGAVLGLNAMVVALGLCAGPVLGGAILAWAGWPWLFAVNVPIGVLSVVMAAAVPYRPPSSGHYDGPGAVLAATAIAAFLLGVHELVDVSGLWLAGLLIALALTMAVLFVRRERAATRPLIPMGLFNGQFTLAVGTAFWSFFGQGTAFVALPFLFQSAFGATPLQSALLFTPWPLVIVLAAPVSGRLADRYSSARLAVLGLVVFTAGLLSLALLGDHPATWDVLLRTGLTGLGFAIFQSPNNRDMMSAAPLAYASSAAGVLNVNRTLAQSAGAGAVSMALALTASGAAGASLLAEAHAATRVMVVAAAGSALSVVVSVLKLRAMELPARTARQ